MAHGIYDDDYQRHDAISLGKIKDEMRSGAIKIGESSSDLLRNASPAGMSSYDRRSSLDRRSSSSSLSALREDGWGGAEDEGARHSRVERPVLRRT